MVQQFLLTVEILHLLKAYCYPSLYFASSVWLTPSINAKLKSNLFLASGKFFLTIEVNRYRNLDKKLQEPLQKLRARNLPLRPQQPQSY